jgi:hypothetical protein
MFFQLGIDALAGPTPIAFCRARSSPRCGSEPNVIAWAAPLSVFDI